MDVRSGKNLNEINIAFGVSVLSFLSAIPHWLRKKYADAKKI